MNDNFSILHEMLDLAKAHSLDRVSFVLLNDKNRKDIDDIQLNHTVFFSFFQYKVPEIYKKSISYGIPVDFSPFLHSLVSESSEYIIEQIESNFVSYIPELEAFFEGKYGKFFYDNYGCFSPRDHASLNYNGDMYGCCVTERSSTYAV